MTRLINIAMGDSVHAVSSRMLAASGAVVRPEFEQRPTDFFRVFQGDYAKLIKALASDSDRNRLIVAGVAEIVAAGHQGTVLLVSDRVAHCQTLAVMLAEQAVEAAVLTGQSPPESRGRIVEAVRAGRVPVLVATLHLIGVGFACPGL